MMDKRSKLLSSLVLAGAILVLASSGAQASILAWRDAPIIGSNAVVDNTAGTITVTVNGNPQVIPDSNTLPSQGYFSLNATTPCDVVHTCDYNFVFAASSVYVDLDSSYTYQGNWAFMGNGPNPAYNFNWPGDVWEGSWGFTTAELYSSVSGCMTCSAWYPEDTGLWRYTETWTGTAGPDNGAIITATRDFRLPEPATLALLGLGLAGLGFSRRRKQV